MASRCRAAVGSTLQDSGNLLSSIAREACWLPHRGDETVVGHLAALTVVRGSGASRLVSWVCGTVYYHHKVKEKCATMLSGILYGMHWMEWSSGQLAPSEVQITGWTKVVVQGSHNQPLGCLC